LGIWIDSPAAGLASDSKEVRMDVMAASEFLALDLNGRTGIGLIGYIIIGGIAGWLASKVVRGGGSGILVDIVVGVVGAFLAGIILLNVLHVDVNSGGYWFTFFVAFGGAAVLLWLVRLVRRG
jgi:uncharacterized membrane protein YeaQ/YmgE (transglycosylase-associated protein family)